MANLGTVINLRSDSENDAGVETKLDGSICSETLRLLKLNKDPKEIDDAFKQAASFVQKIVKCYSENIAIDEVGYNGRAQASKEPPLCGRNVTALLYGRVQSGKTQGMILSTALAVDNGFRVIIILTSDSVELVRQTFNRFSFLKEAGINVYSSINPDEWQSDLAHVRKHLASHGLIVVCSKNQSHLQNLNNFLSEIDARSYPSLIFDDEADNASLDTNNKKRAVEAYKGGNPNSVPLSRINRLLVGAGSIGVMLKHSIYIQVTATPYSMLLLNSEDLLKPSLIHLLEPGDGYTGGEDFFSNNAVESETPPLIFVDAEEMQKASKLSYKTAPEGLKRAIAFFVVASAVQRIESKSNGLKHCMLCHPASTKGSHEIAAAMIKLFFSDIESALESIGPNDLTSRNPYLNWALIEASKTFLQMPTLSQIAEVANKGLLRTRGVKVINSENGESSFTADIGLNFVVGGNIIGRGLTIENLLVTYYVRPTQIAQMDTMYQHARMFGYRNKIWPFVRVFLPENLALRFNAIHNAESSLREDITKSDGMLEPFIMTIPGLRATRPSVLDPYNIATVVPGAHIFPKYPPVYKEHEVHTILGRVSKYVKDSIGANLPTGANAHMIGVERLKYLIDIIPVHKTDEELGDWDKDLLKRILDHYATLGISSGHIWYREMNRNLKRYPSGSATGKEIDTARATGLPVLMLFKDVSKEVRPYEFWYPSLISPEGKFKLVTNVKN